jgi:hypothetical protein
MPCDKVCRTGIQFGRFLAKSVSGCSLLHFYVSNSDIFRVGAKTSVSKTRINFVSLSSHTFHSHVPLRAGRKRWRALVAKKEEKYDIPDGYRIGCRSNFVVSDWVSGVYGLFLDKYHQCLAR